MDGNNFPKNICFICLDGNKELIISDAKTLELYKELINAELQTFNNYEIQFCLDCLFLMRKFKNFKMTAENSIETITQVHQSRSTVQIIEVKDDTLIRSPPELPSTSNQHSIETPDYDVFIRGKRITKPRTDVNHRERLMTEIYQPKTRNPRNFRQKYEYILKNQPVVLLNRMKIGNQMPRLDRERSSSSDIVTDRNSNNYCSECKTIVSGKPFSTHVIQTHFIRKGLQSICKICRRVLYSMSGSLSHFDTHRKFLNVKKCEECPSVFTRWSQYKRHRSCYHKVELHICEYCYAKFSKKQLWVTHVIENHPENLQCLECGEVLEDKTAYEHHRLREHLKIQTEYVEVPSTSSVNEHFHSNRNDPPIELLSDEELCYMSIPLLESEF